MIGTLLITIDKHEVLHGTAEEDVVAKDLVGTDLDLPAESVILLFAGIIGVVNITSVSCHVISIDC